MSQMVRLLLTFEKFIQSNKQNLLIFPQKMHTFRNILSDYLIRCNHLQIIGESIRQSLAKNSYFQYETIFQRLDKHSKGYLIPADFSEFMLENNIYPSEKQLYIIFRDFDQERIATVTLNNFKRVILPKENQRLYKQAIERKYYQSKNRLEIDLQYQLTKYFEHQIKVHNQLQQIRSKLNQLSVSYPEEAFSLIDTKKKLQIMRQDIDFFLRSSSKILKPQEIDRIFRVLNQSCNKNDPKLISFSRFQYHIDPFREGFYQGYSQRLIEKRQLEQSYIAKKVLNQNNSLHSSKRQIDALWQLQSLRVSRRQLEQRLIQKEKEILKSFAIEQEQRRNHYF